MTDIFTINAVDYHVLKLLGHGKSGYSYLVEDGENNKYVMKKIHHEPIDYYTFGDKFKSELDAYEFLKRLGILMPKLLDYDSNQEILIKEYIEGNTVFESVSKDLDISNCLMRIFEISELCQKNEINIDFFPTNFINKNEGLYYIDYEFNEYMEKWNFQNWGIKYWSKTDEFHAYINNKSTK